MFDIFSSHQWLMPTWQILLRLTKNCQGLQCGFSMNYQDLSQLLHCRVPYLVITLSVTGPLKTFLVNLESSKLTSLFQNLKSYASPLDTNLGLLQLLNMVQICAHQEMLSRVFTISSEVYSSTGYTLVSMHVVNVSYPMLSKLTKVS